MKTLITLTVNERDCEIAVEPKRTLIEVLRGELGLTGAKEGCGVGDCGTCTVLLDGRPINSCLMLAVQAVGHKITTIEGLSEHGLHPIQQAFVDKGAIQCGYCSPGMILVAKALLDENPQANEKEIREAISGNLCRCTGYQKIVEAIYHAGQQMKAGKEDSDE